MALATAAQARAAELEKTLEHERRVAEERVSDLKKALDHERAIVAGLSEELRQLRRPWWRRLWRLTQHNPIVPDQLEQALGLVLHWRRNVLPSRAERPSTIRQAVELEAAILEQHLLRQTGISLAKADLGEVILLRLPDQVDVVLLVAWIRAVAGRVTYLVRRTSLGQDALRLLVDLPWVRLAKPEPHLTSTWTEAVNQHRKVTSTVDYIRQFDIYH